MKNRRDFLKVGATGLAGLVGAQVLPASAHALQSVTYDGGATYDGVRSVTYDPKANLQTGKIPLQVITRNDEHTDVRYNMHTPTIEFNGPKNYNRVRIAAGDYAVETTFPKRTIHGGFNGKHAVIVDVTDGVVEAIHKQQGNRPLLVLYDASGRISSGSNIIQFKENEITGIETDPNQKGHKYFGSTPLRVRPAFGKFDYYFYADGGIKKIAR